MLKKISEIKVNDRIRKQVGDLASLKSSIKEIGLINPIIINKNNNLIAGERRLIACKELGLKEIECKTFNFERAEIDENECRKDFTVEERLGIAEWFEREESKKAKQRMKLGDPRQKFAEGKTTDIVAQKTGFGSGETYRQAKKVFKEAPKEIKDKVNAGEMKISRAHKLITAKKSDNPEWLKLFNIWNFQSRDDNYGIKHFGNQTAELIMNLLYYYTNENDLIYDVFAGGGLVNDVCKKMNRRCYSTDIKPTRKFIKKLDVISELPNIKPNFIFLDPPYWKQAENKYTNLKEDLANQSLDDFYKNIFKLFNKINNKYKNFTIALLISNSQWVNNKQVEPHAFKIWNEMSKYWKFKHHIIVPYSTQQYNGNQINIAKKEKIILQLHRDLLIFN